MVVHDPAQKEVWTEVRITREAEKQKRTKKKEKPTHRWPVVAVQSLACVMVLVFALLFRLAGGGAYDELRRNFYTALQNNELMAVLSRIWDGDPFEDVADTPPEDVKPSDFTAEESSVYPALGLPEGR